MTGISTRFSNASIGNGSNARAQFTAPSGTAILGLQTWNGGFERTSCYWAMEIQARPSGTTMIGKKNGVSCEINKAQVAGPSDFYSAPVGTTALLQNVQCGASTCQGGARFHTSRAVVLISDPTKPTAQLTGGGLSTNRWLRGEQALAFVARDNTGIRSASVQLSPRAPAPAPISCDATRPAPCSDQVRSISQATGDLPDGTHPLRLTITDAAGNTSTYDRTIKTDNTPPARVTPTVLGGQGWRRSNGFTLRWSNPPQAHAPITRVRYELCPPSGVNCTTGQKDGANVQELSNVSVKALGDNTLKLWLEDEAGNQTEALASDPSHLRLDPDPPRLAFLPQDSSDPLTVAVKATDSLSGLAAGEIEMRARGGRTWHELNTTVERGRIVAEIDDERFGNGTYDFRARASDRAGNEASTGTRTDGARAAVRLPVRISTGLRAGFPRTKVKRRNGKRRRVRVLARKATFSFGRRATVRGSLANPDGQPIDGAFITVFARRDLPGGGFDPVAFIRTDGRGRFSYRARATENRTLRFRYGGTRRIRAASRDIDLRVRGASSIRVDRTRLVNGEVANFSGRVRTRPIPAAGKLIEIQAYFRRKWRTVSTTRTDAAGRWRFPYQFGATTQTVRYRFRVRLPREGGYPFATGRSRVAFVTVRGL